MAPTFTVNNRQIWGRKRAHSVSMAFDGAYPAGGEAIAASDAGLTVIDDVIVSGINESGFAPAWDRSASKILMYESGADGDALDENASAEVDTEIVEMMVIGT